jgi:hypothetical protein
MGAAKRGVATRPCQPGSPPVPPAFAASRAESQATRALLRGGLGLADVVLLAGVVALVFAIRGRAGVPGGIGGFAVISAVVTLTLTAVLQAVDGVALKAAADAWFSAPAAEQPARLAAVEAVRWLEWAVRSYQRAMLGVSLILVAAQIVISVRIPRPIGYFMVLSGLAYIAQGLVVGAEGFSSNGTVPGLLGFAFDLAWMIWLVLVAWERPQAVRPLAAAAAAS